MDHRKPFLLALALSAGAFALPGQAQVFFNNTADIPSGPGQNNSETEHIDFGDVDLDGDWDIVWGDGGDGGNDQNRIWMNQGGEQGGALGTFFDATSFRFPAIQDDTRDMEFADIDLDGDLDIYSSNTSQISNQSNLWWINRGGLQGGTYGFFDDDTAARWVGVGGAGSSVAPSQVLGSGGFIDWSCDCDFGDLDNDGDLDLVHSTYGSGFGGLVPTRIYLNDGDGFFSEFNPGGFQLSGATITPGSSALWAKGVFQPETTNTTGASADIATNTLDVDLGDTDGDFDLDLLHGDRDANPRFFFNDFEEDGGVLLGFRDVSNQVFPGGDWATTGNYEQELGDVDGDGDLDLYGLNWTGFSDVLRKNNGSGVFGAPFTMPGSGADDNEADFFDYDNDGDLDVFVANFSGTDKLYANNGNGNYNLVGGSGIPPGLIGLDADACDVDFDGDYDVFVANDGFQVNRYLENITQTPDTTAPYIPRFERTFDSPTSATPHIVRAQVYDNAPYYITWFNPTVLNIEVEGCTLPSVPMMSSGGQIFRGELPGNLLGDVTYSVTSTDEYGNSGTSGNWTFNSFHGGGAIGGNYGSGQPAGALPEPGISALSVAFPDSTLYVAGTGLPAGTVWIMSLSVFQQTPAFTLPPFGTFNIAAPTIDLVGVADASGCAVVPYFLGADIPSAASIYFQFFGINLGAGDLLASSEGLEVITQ